MTTYLGLDIGAKCSHYALTDDGETFQQGTLTLDELRDFLFAEAVTAIGCEYTGRLAEPWSFIASQVDVPTYFMHSVERRAIVRLNKQRTKTDKRDAQTICRTLFLYLTPHIKKGLGMHTDLFTDAATVKIAWQLRARLASIDEEIEQRDGAKKRAITARRVGNPHIASRWEQYAAMFHPEDALKEAVDFCKEQFPLEYDALSSIPGIADRVATYLIGSLMPIERFPSVDKAIAYIGLNPRHKWSGDSTPKPKLARTGNPKLRALLYFAAVSQVRRDTDFGRCYKRMTEKELPGKAAVVQVSRKMFRVAYRLLNTKQLYREPDDNRPGHFKPLPEPVVKPVLPAHLVSQTQYAKLRGLSRQRVNQLIKAGKLPVEAWQDHVYVVHPVAEGAVETTTRNVTEGEQE